MIFGYAALEAFGAETEEQQRLLEEFIHYLVIHEIGHTLGLNHNFRSSHLHSLDDVFDPDKTYPLGLARLGDGLSDDPLCAARRAAGAVLDHSPGSVRSLGDRVRLFARARRSGGRSRAPRDSARPLHGARGSRSATMRTTCARPARPSIRAR